MSERTSKEQLQVIEHAGAQLWRQWQARENRDAIRVQTFCATSAQSIAVVMFNRDAAPSFRRRFEQAVHSTALQSRTFT